MFLAKLLVGDYSPIFAKCRVDGVGFQKSYFGLKTDDLLVTCSLDNEKHQLAIQAKYTFHIGVNNSKCVKTFQNFWRDFKETAKFNPDNDALVLVTRSVGSSLHDLVSLLNQARNSSDFDDFVTRMAAPGLVSKKAKKHQQTIRSILKKIGSDAPSEIEFWRFLRCIHVLPLDFASSTNSDVATTKQILDRATDGSATDSDVETTWNELLVLAASSAPSGIMLKRSDLPHGMRSTYGSTSAPYATLMALKEYSGPTLDEICLTIADSITLLRDDKVTKTVNALAESQVVVLGGPPGYGKSGLAKMVIQQHTNDYACLSFRAEEFAVSHIDRALPDSITSKRFKACLETQEKILIHVESLERLFKADSPFGAFVDLIGMVKLFPNVKLLLTCRDHSIDAAWTEFFEQSRLLYSLVEVPPLREEEVEAVVNAVPRLAAPTSNTKLRQLLSAPLYLDMAAGVDWSVQQDMPLDSGAFRKKCWDAVVRKDSRSKSGLSDRREQALVDLSILRAQRLQHLVPTGGIDAEALDELYKDGIVLRRGRGRAAPAHDIMEDWAIMHRIESLIEEHEWAASPIATAVSKHPIMQRIFREWLKEALHADYDKAIGFVLHSYKDTSLPRHFRDNVLISVLLSPAAKKFVLQQKVLLFAYDAQLLVSLIRLTCVACMKAKDRSSDQTMDLPTLLVPEGEVWMTMLEIIADNLDRLLPKHTEPILDLVENWTQGIGVDDPTPDGATLFGLIAYALLEQPEEYYDTGLQRRVLKMIAKVPSANRVKFVSTVEQASGRTESLYNSPNVFAKLLIDGVSAIMASRDFPEEVAQFVRSLCCLPEQYAGKASEFGIIMDVEPEFGLHAGISMDFSPGSAFQGPFLALLMYHQKIGIRLILDLVNHAGEWYGNRRWTTAGSEPVPRIKISVSGHEVEQWADDDLWLAYRGMPNVPYVLKCALMALEYFLLRVCKNSVESLLLRILRESNNVMTTAVVASVCNAYPDLSGKATFALLGSLECIVHDHWRAVKESETSRIAISGSGPIDMYYSDERKESNALPHRRYDLKTLAVRLQYGEKKGQVWEIIDDHRAKIPDTQRADEDRARLFILHKMDIRRLKPIDVTPPSDGDGAENGSGTVGLVPDTSKMDADLLNFVNANTRKIQQPAAALSLLNWGLKQWEQNSENEDAKPWRSVLASAKDRHQQNAAFDFGDFLRQGPSIVAAVCVRDHWDDMDGSDQQWCINTLAAEVERNSDRYDYVTHMSSDSTGAEHAASVLPKLLVHYPEDKKILSAATKAITHGIAAVSNKAVMGMVAYLKPEHRSLMLRYVGVIAMLSNCLAQYEQQHAEKEQQSDTSKRQDLQNLLERVREAVVEGAIDAEQELTKLDLGSHHGRNAVWRIMPMLSRAPDLPLAKDLFTRIGQAITDSWAADSETPDGNDDYKVWNHLMDRLAGTILTLSSGEVSLYCRPFLDAVNRHPNEVALFIERLVVHEDSASGDTSFWDIWRAFAQRVIAAAWLPDIRFSGSTGAALVSKMLLNVGWKVGSRSWRRLAGHGYEVNDFVARLPAAPPVLANFTRYLYEVGESSLPDALTVVANRLQARSQTESLSRDSVFHLASILERYVYGQPQLLKSDPEMQTATLTILEHLVEARSPNAYRMRDDFATPDIDPQLKTNTETTQDKK